MDNMNGAISQQMPGGSPPQKQNSTGRPANPMASGVTLQFHIDRVTLPSMSRADTTRVMDAMKQGLAKRANQFRGRDWQALSTIDRLDGGTLPAGARPDQIGEHLAAQIFRRLSP
jgi:hypothetical protein